MIGELSIHRRQARNPATAGVTPLAPNQVTGLRLWLKPETLAGLGTSDAVATWADSSGDFRDATQATGTQQPTWEGGTPYGYATFDGVDDFLSFTQISTIRAVFMVCRFWNALTDGAAILGSAAQYDFHGGHSATGDQDKVLNLTYAHANLRNGTASVNGTSTAPLAIVKPASFSLLVFLPTGNVLAENIANDRDSIFAPLDVRELFIYNAAPSAGDVAGLIAWARNKHGL